MRGRLTKGGQLRFRHNAMKGVCQLDSYCWSLRLIGPEERRSDTGNGWWDGSQRHGESLRAHPFQPADSGAVMQDIVVAAKVAPARARLAGVASGRMAAAPPSPHSREWGFPIRERLLPQPFALGPRTFFRYAHQHSSPAMSIPYHPSELEIFWSAMAKAFVPIPSSRPLAGHL
jgi:hypothetical protein